MGRNHLVLLAAWFGLTASGCSEREYVFKSDPLGHGPNEYEIYTDRVPRSVHKGEDTVRSGVMILPPMQPLVRTPARQKEVMIALQQFAEKMYNLEERRSKETVKWLQAFMNEHRGLPPDQPVAIQSALDTLLRTRERASKKIIESTDEKEKATLEEGIKKLDEELGFYKKYMEERPARAAAYQKQMEELEASNKRLQIWQARHVRMTNTMEWTQKTGSSADAELNRAMRELADTLALPDVQTKLEVLAMAVNIGGSDAKELLPRVRALAADQAAASDVRDFAAKAAQNIEAQGS